jgi:hypothetical protein
MIAGRSGPFLQPRAVLSRRRVLPVAAEVLLDVGDRVAADTVVARAPGRGRLRTLNAARILDVLPGEVPGAMVVAVGDTVAAGQELARTRGVFGLLASVCRAPVAGTVMAVSPHTGRILLEEPAAPLEVQAFLPGIVSAVHPERGATVSGWAARVAGVFGVGGERCGDLLPLVGRPSSMLEAAQIDGAVAGRVLLGGAGVRADALGRAAALGAVGLITGGIGDLDLSGWLGRSTVLADTTGIPGPLTVVVTGGFGRVPMDADTFELLRAYAGQLVCVSGWTRVRAGAVRPEVIVPLAEEPTASATHELAPELAVGSLVQVVRAPWFGRRGRVGRLPEDPQVVASGARCLVAEVDLASGDGTVAVPRCNLEVLAGP